MFLKKIRLLVAVVPILLQAQNLQEVEKRVTEFTLPNGMKQTATLSLCLDVASG